MAKKQKPDAAAPAKPEAKSRARRGGRESLAARSQRARRILAALHAKYPAANCALHHRNAFELLVATILSAQSTDETVNKVTPELFARFPDPRQLATADPAEVEGVIHRTGFFRQKTRSLLGSARLLAEEFDGQVPSTMEELLRLPGVARKTANVVLGTWFGKNEGVVVDTHVGRISERLRLTWSARDSKDAVRIEQDLQRVIPREDWTYFSHALIWHGRQVCSARKPACGTCSLADECPSAHEFGGATSAAASAVARHGPPRAAGAGRTRPKLT